MRRAIGRGRRCPGRCGQCPGSCGRCPGRCAQCPGPCRQPLREAGRLAASADRPSAGTGTGGRTSAGTGVPPRGRRAEAERYLGPAPPDAAAPPPSRPHEVNRSATVRAQRLRAPARPGLTCAHASLRVPLPDLRRHLRTQPPDGGVLRPRGLPRRARRHGEAPVDGRRRHGRVVVRTGLRAARRRRWWWRLLRRGLLRLSHRSGRLPGDRPYATAALPGPQPPFPDAHDRPQAAAAARPASRHREDRPHLHRRVRPTPAAPPREVGSGCTPPREARPRLHRHVRPASPAPPHEARPAPRPPPQRESSTAPLRTRTRKTAPPRPARGTSHTAAAHPATYATRPVRRTSTAVPRPARNSGPVAAPGERELSPARPRRWRVRTPAGCARPPVLPVPGAR